MKKSHDALTDHPGSDEPAVTLDTASAGEVADQSAAAPVSRYRPLSPFWKEVPVQSEVAKFSSEVPVRQWSLVAPRGGHPDIGNSRRPAAHVFVNADGGAFYRANSGAYGSVYSVDHFSSMYQEFIATEASQQALREAGVADLPPKVVYAMVQAEGSTRARIAQDKAAFEADLGGVKLRNVDRTALDEISRLRQQIAVMEENHQDSFKPLSRHQQKKGQLIEDLDLAVGEFEDSDRDEDAGQKLCDRVKEALKVASGRGPGRVDFQKEVG